jgi:hypothetical protein
VRPAGSPTAVVAAADAVSQGASLAAAASNELTLAAARPLWSGDAAEQFRASVARIDEALATLVQASAFAAHALRVYAAELSRLEREADSLAHKFAGYGIAIDAMGWAIPTPGVHDPEALDDNLRRYGQTFEDQARALRHAADTAAAVAIRDIDNARALLHEHTSFWKYLRSQFLEPFNFANTIQSTYSSSAATYATVSAALHKRETQLSALRKEAERKTSKSRAARAWARYRALLDATAKERLNLSEAAADSKAIAQKLPHSSRLSASFGQVAAGKSVPAGLARIGSAPAVRSLPVVGTALTAVQTGREISAGESPTKVITTNAASLVAGSIAAEVAVGIVAGATVIAGAPIIVGIAAGTLVAVGVGYAVNQFFETEIGHDVAQTIDHAVGGAADAVGDAVTSGWRKLFG